MTSSEIFRRLEELGIRIIKDKDAPINGQVQKVPCLAMLSKTTVIGSDNGNVELSRRDWQVILLTAERDDKKTAAILAALKGCGKVTVELFPELSPYQTTFKFTTFDL